MTGIRAIESKTGNRQIHDSRIARRKLLVAQADASRNTGSKILREHIRRICQSPHDVEARVGLDVDGDRSFVAIVVEKRRRKSAASRRHVPRVISAGRRFDLDNVGALIRQHHRCQRTRNHRRQIDDFVTAQWSGHATPR